MLGGGKWVEGEGSGGKGEGSGGKGGGKWGMPTALSTPSKLLHHNLCITLLMEAETVLVKQPHYIQTKMYRLYRKMTIYGHFSI